MLELPPPEWWARVASWSKWELASTPRRSVPSPMVCKSEHVYTRKQRHRRNSSGPEPGMISSVGRKISSKVERALILVACQRRGARCWGFLGVSRVTTTLLILFNIRVSCDDALRTSSVIVFKSVLPFTVPLSVSPLVNISALATRRGRMKAQTANPLSQPGMMTNTSPMKTITPASSLEILANWTKRETS